VFSPEDEKRLLAILCVWCSVIMDKVLIRISDVPHVEPLSENYMLRSIQFCFYDGDCKMNWNCEGTGI